MNISIMKRSACWLALLGGLAGAAWSAPSQAGRAGDFGAGIIIGDPTGLTAKWWLTDLRAVDMALAWDLSGSEDRLELHADHLWHFPLNVSGLEGRLPLYIGLGGRLLTGEDARVGVRVPLGICYLFPRVPVELFAEITPLLDLTPNSDVSVNGGVGARFYFQ